MLLPVFTLVVLIVFLMMMSRQLKNLEIKQKEIEWRIEALEHPASASSDK